MKASPDWSTSSVSSSVLLSEKGFDLSSFSLSPSMSVASQHRRDLEKANFGRLAEEALARGKQAAAQQFEALQSPEPDYYQASSISEESEELAQTTKGLMEIISKKLSSRQKVSSQTQIDSFLMQQPPVGSSTSLSEELETALAEGTPDIQQYARQLYDREGATSVADVLQKFLPMLAHSFLRERWCDIVAAWQTGAGSKKVQLTAPIPERVPMVSIPTNVSIQRHQQKEAFYPQSIPSTVCLSPAGNQPLPTSKPQQTTAPATRRRNTAML
eukprot:TRINITY_DN28055_c0_g1_i1.p1 TRINITY_DN28055_c0_g1~~TRINITY_DN28055_c0_g1_i1.p1  ORF type:complete len:272 (+),score=55.42 TRINITY_DN28055_c0_g1_i1:55-870(+)